jgi:hypothetical protein
MRETKYQWTWVAVDQCLFAPRLMVTVLYCAGTGRVSLMQDGRSWRSMAYEDVEEKTRGSKARDGKGLGNEKDTWVQKVMLSGSAKDVGAPGGMGSVRYGPMRVPKSKDSPGAIEAIPGARGGIISGLGGGAPAAGGGAVSESRRR